VDKVERNEDIRHKYGNEIYVIERFVINLLWKGIILYLWVLGGFTFDVLWKGNITFLWVLENDIVFMIVGDSNFS
jgi:hypothetical protein